MSSETVSTDPGAWIEGSAEAMLVCTAEGEILATNPAAALMFRRSDEDLRHGGRDSLFSERDRALFEKFVDASSRVEKAEGLLLLVRGDDSHFMAEISTTLHRADDGRKLSIFVIRDLSERFNEKVALPEAEAPWRIAIEGAGDGVFDWKVPSGELWWSRRWKEMLGFSENEIGPELDEWMSRVHPEDLPRVRSVVQAHLDGSTASYAIEHRLRGKDGGWKWILARGMAIERGAGGAALRIVGTHEDISERKLAELTLERSRNALD